MMDFIKPVLDKLTGFDYWFAVVILVLGLTGWLWLGTPKRREQKRLFHQFQFALLMFLTGGLGIVLHHVFFSPDYTFPKGVAGILVLRINGDDAGHSLQNRLIAALDNELASQSVTENIEVRAADQCLDEGPLGWANAHRDARKLGHKYRALLVVWGNCDAGTKSFTPRITIVNEIRPLAVAGERATAVQNISEIRLPNELVDEPIFLTHFVAGYSFYSRNKHADALGHFEQAIQRKVGSAAETADLKFFVATCHCCLAQGQKTMETHLRLAIDLFADLVGYYQANGNLGAWAATQNNLGNAYGSLPTGDQAENLKRAIAAYEAALRVRTEKNFCADWAATQNNLGVAYRNLHAGNRAENLKKAIAAFEAALRVYTEKDFPAEWAGTQNNLGLAYGELPTGDRVENQKRAFAAYEAALRVETEKDFPAEWASTQNNLGNAYVDLTTGDRAANLEKAISAFEAALRVTTEKDFPTDWAATQNNLGLAYRNLPTGERAANQKKAIATFEATLRVYTEKDFPTEWACTQINLGATYGELSSGSRAENLRKAKGCLENGLKIFTASSFPDAYRTTSSYLERVKREIAGLSKN